MKPLFHYAAIADRVIDGDTIDVILDFGFSLKQKMRLRLADIDTPELRSKDVDERARARDASMFVMDQLFHPDVNGCGEPRELVIKTIKTRSGKERQTFGRYVAEVNYKKDGTWFLLNQELVLEGHAVRSSR